MPGRVGRDPGEQGLLDRRQHFRRPDAGGQWRVVTLKPEKIARGGVGEHEPPIAEVGGIGAGHQDHGIAQSLHHQRERRRADRAGRPPLRTAADG